MKENEFNNKETIFAEKLGVTDKDFEIYRKVQKYFYQKSRKSAPTS